MRARPERTTGREGGGRVVLALVVFLAAGLASCRIGTDLPGEEVATLEATEASAAIAELLRVSLANSLFSDNHVSFTHAHGTQAPHTHPVQGPYLHDFDIVDGPLPTHHNFFEFDLSFETACSLGGSVLVEAEISGEGNPAVEPGAVHYIMIQTHDACSVTLAGAPFLLDAAPYLEVQANASNDGAGTVRVDGVLVGGIGWQAEAKGGVCEVDLAFEASAVSLAEITSVSVTGTFCDLTLDEAVPVG